MLQKIISNILCNKKSQYLLLIILFIFMSLVRIIHINADPPAGSLSWSGVFLTDEGWWTHNAVNKVLFGDWIVDDFNPIFITPAFTFFQFISFKLLGVSFASARLVCVFFSLFTLIFIFLSLKDWFKKEIVLLSVVFLGFNYVYIMYNRLALLETPMIFFLVLAFYFWQKGLKNKKYNYFLAGISLFIAYLVKPTAIFAIPVYIVASLFVSVFEERKKEKILLYFLVGLLSISFMWLLFWVLPNYSWWAFCNSYYITEKFSLSPITHIQSIVTFFGSSFFLKMPIVSSLSFFYVMISFYELITKPHKLNPIEIFVISWLIIGSGFLAFFAYQPVRYFMILIPSMCIAASVFLNKLIIINAFKTPKYNLYSIFYVFIWLEMINLAVSFNFIKSLVLLKEENICAMAIESSLLAHQRTFILMFSLAFLVLTTIIVFVLYLLKSRISNKEINISKRFIVAIVVIVIICSGIANGLQYSNGVKTPEYSLVNTAKEVKAIVGEKGILTGNIANTLALENNIFTITLMEERNKNNSIEFNITHLILIQYNIENLKRKYPKTFDNAVFLKKFEVLNNYYTGDYCYLYKIS